MDEQSRIMNKFQPKPKNLNLYSLIIKTDERIMEALGLKVPPFERVYDEDTKIRCELSLPRM